MKEKVLILTQGRFGGTDLLLGRLTSWLLMREYEVEVLTPTQRPTSDSYDFVFLPTSEVSRLWRIFIQLKTLKHVCVWGMGYAAFNGAYVSIKDEKILENHSGWSLRAILIKLLKYRAGLSVNSFLNANSLVFTDEVGANADIGIGYDYSRVGNIVFPIVVDREQEVLFDYSPSTDSLRLGWVGRIDMDFKFYAIERVIIDTYNLLEKLSRSYKKIIFYIVGGGNAIDLLKGLVSKFDGVEFVFISRIENNQLGKFIREHVDLMFAMGTSALEAAKNKIPTIIVPPMDSPDTNPLIGYRWVADSLGFSLGEFSYAGVSPVQRNISMENVYNEFESEKNKISEKSFDYVSAFYADAVFEGLIDYSRSSAPGYIIYFRSFENYTLKQLKILIKRVSGRSF